MVDINVGKRLVKLARTAVSNVLSDSSNNIDQCDLIQRSSEFGVELRKEMGLFVSIKDFNDGSLRGCIGFVSPISVGTGVQKAATLAAFSDPRFSPISKDDLDEIIFEVSLMTEPEVLEYDSMDECKSKINLGEDGLIISNNGNSGLLLPQVPIEHDLTKDEFLDSLCRKAGLTIEFILDGNTDIMKFRCQIFKEEYPNGDVVVL